MISRLDTRLIISYAKTIRTEITERSSENMKGFTSQKEVERIKEQYPVGTRIELICMDDPHSPIESGMQGTIECVDDAGTLHMKWDNGRTLGIVPGEDQFKVISKPIEEMLDNEQKQSMGGMSM